VCLASCVVFAKLNITVATTYTVLRVCDGNTLFQWSTLDILLTQSNFVVSS